VAVEAILPPRPAPAREAPPGRAWWIEPALTVVAYSAFVIYATWSVFDQVNVTYYPYVSPFFSTWLGFGLIRVPIFAILIPILETHISEAKQCRWKLGIQPKGVLKLGLRMLTFTIGDESRSEIGVCLRIRRLGFYQPLEQFGRLRVILQVQIDGCRASQRRDLIGVNS